MKLRIDGIPVHALLVHFPIAGWPVVTAFALAAALGHDAFAQPALYANAATLLVGALAVGAGFAEFASLPAERAVRDAAVRHMLLAVSAWTVYLVMLLLQATGFVTAAAATGVAALLVLVLAGHAGARLVFRYGLPRHG